MGADDRLSVARILHVAAVEFTATKLLAPQMAELRRIGFDVRLACKPDASGFAPALDEFAPSTVEFSRSGSPIDMMRGTTQLLRLIRRSSPDIVHLHSPATALPARVGLAIRRQGVKVVYTVHGFAQSWDDMTGRDRALDTAEKLLSRVTDTLLFQSREDLEAAQLRRYHGRLRFLGNGIEDLWFTPIVERPLRVHGEPLRVAYVGRIVREKGVLELLEAVAELEGIELTMIGSALDSDRDDVTNAAQALAKRAGGRVTFAGMLSRDAVVEALRANHCFVLPSWREGVPRSMIEAMSSGLPIIGTDIRGSRELVRPGREGWIVPARSVPALIGALTEAMSMEPSVLRGIGRAARERASTEFRESKVLERLVAAYGELGFHP